MEDRFSWRRHLAGDFCDLRTTQKRRRDAGATTRPFLRSCSSDNL